jgi:hypothetical protein
MKHPFSTSFPSHLHRFRPIRHLYCAACASISPVRAWLLPKVKVLNYYFTQERKYVAIEFHYSILQAKCCCYYLGVCAAGGPIRIVTALGATRARDLHRHFEGMDGLLK